MIEKWHAVYTKPRWEKKVAGIFSQLGIENYCPLNKVKHQWSDRQKIVYEPLFTSYVFVRIIEKDYTQIRKVNGVLNFVYWLGKPAVIKDKEIDTIKRFLKEYSCVKLEKAPFNINDRVKVTGGALTDKEGTVVAIKNQSAVVALPSLGYLMRAEIDKEYLHKVPTGLG